MPRGLVARHLGVILAPSALLALGAALMLLYPTPGMPAWSTWFGFALQAALLFGAVIWWGPLMARLETSSGGLVPELFKLMLATRWARVGVVSTYGVLILWIPKALGVRWVLATAHCGSRARNSASSGACGGHR